MSLLDKLDDDALWWEFFTYRMQTGNLSGKRLADLQTFISQGEYHDVVNGIRAGRPFAIPEKKLVSKAHSPKKRVLYVFPDAENNVLKLLAYLVIRKYDYLFAPNLYSFRAHTNAQAAVAHLVAYPDICQCYSYKVDVSDYFGSVDIDLLLPKLERAFQDDLDLYRFFKGMLRDSRVRVGTDIAVEPKGIMAGSPISGFLANVYLSDLDWHFARQPFAYARYSDDIIVFARTEQDIDSCERQIAHALARLGLCVNADKEMRARPHEEWMFLGFSHRDGVVDISRVSVGKIKAKMRRKSRALLRWRARKGLDNEYAVKAFIRVFNRKLFNGLQGNDLNWTRWFYPLITTDASLKELDAYMQDCIRYIATEKRTKARYEFRYDDMKRLGYRSLVHEYYSFHKSRQDERSEAQPKTLTGGILFHPGEGWMR